MRSHLHQLRHSARHDGDRGDTAIEAVIVIPLLVAIALVVMAGARLSLAVQKTDAAAQTAARAASLERTPAAGQSAARRAAADALGARNQTCTSTRVTTDTSGLSAQLGQVSTVTATVSCTVPLGDLLLLGGGPGVRTMTSSFTSIVDAYRERG
ncbi:TadE/TadG family type IV pilus assembly protein [Streptomyces sp. WAC01280]|uniref:TadE/TadG family type IV pilus assembly protein n=1 Tax=Streptomyces sp. WAC01280 TaxID=2487424 RepID=UPI000F794BF6|nr:TadE/TadG family type IV pilus assembly protein [Streptomyces sp. WAC01280]RSS57501.1 pilus assembly protein [Streptomyces sp. WAC01280]